MLRFIGALVIVLLIIGPLLERSGMLSGGIWYEFVNLEVRALVNGATWVGNLVAGRRV